jgi:hypothetical protein
MLIRRTLRVPRREGPHGDGAAVARQLDAVLAGVGFTCSGELLAHVTALEPGTAMDLAVEVVRAARELVGDHVPHNAYFLRFPEGVPDTLEFWVACLRDALVPGGRRSPAELLAELFSGRVGLLDLPRYGRYQHTHAELLAAHDELVASASDRMTVLQLGEPLDREAQRLHLELAGSPVPLGGADVELLAELAAHCRDEEQPARVPVRETRAVLNAVRLADGRPLVGVDTVTDVLRTACRAVGGDVSLQRPTRLRSLPRAQRRRLLAALDAVVAADDGALADVARHAGPWKRLGERLHPHEHPRYEHAARVFAVARGERRVPSPQARVEVAFAAGRPVEAASLMAAVPGALLRSLDRVLRTAGPGEVDAVLDLVASVLGGVSGRVLCAVREHLQNRAAPDAARVFVGRARRAWTERDTRPALPAEVVARATALVDAELAARLPAHDHLVVDPAVLDVAVPLSGRATEDGLAVLPRGSRSRVDGDRLRFFVHWRERARTTDLDLSALLLDAEFEQVGQVSYTNLRDGGAVHSGDVTSAPEGASEFIDLPLAALEATHVVPQVNVFSGEGFDEVAESLFGWMVRGDDQRGAPFEPRTVRTRSELRGAGRVALPAVFSRTAEGWTATWMHLHLAGRPRFNRIEGNRVSTALLARAILERRHLTVGDLVRPMAAKARTTTTWEPGTALAGPVAFVGLERPDGLPPGSTAITVGCLADLVPA